MYGSDHDSDEDCRAYWDAEWREDWEWRGWPETEGSDDSGEWGAEDWEDGEWDGDGWGVGADDGEGAGGDEDNGDTGETEEGATGRPNETPGKSVWTRKCRADKRP